jgi:hypothetical protein
MWWIASAWAVPWWVAEPESDRLRESLGRYWAGAEVEVAVGAPSPGQDGFWYDGRALRLRRGDRMWSREVPDDPDVWVVVGRSWFEAAPGTPTETWLPPPDRRDPNEAIPEDPDLGPPPRPAPVRGWQLLLGWQGDTAFPYGGPRGGARYRSGPFTAELGGATSVAWAYRAANVGYGTLPGLDEHVDILSFDASVAVSAGLLPPAAWNQPLEGKPRGARPPTTSGGFLLIAGFDARVWLDETNVPIAGVGLLAGPGYEGSFDDQLGLRLIAYILGDRPLARTDWYLAVGWRVDVWLPLRGSAEPS